MRTREALVAMNTFPQRKYSRSEEELQTELSALFLRNCSSGGELGRRWIINERSLTYLQGAALRFHGHPSLKTFFDQHAA
jgi:hypothetical protein